MNSSLSHADKKRISEFDWKEIYRRVEYARQTIEKGETPTAEEKKRILKERATALAKETPEEVRAGTQIEVVEFLLAQETYGVESSYVREIYPLKEITPVPCTPAFVLGIISVRGQMLSVIDIKKFFDLPEKGLTDLNKVIILHNAEMEFGILADNILGVRTIEVASLQPSLPTFTGIREEYLRGVTKNRNIVLDAGNLLSDKNIVLHEEVVT